ncbi:PHD finger protein 21B-like [Myxocyprinus asiaticus]|uniref:PHD finger protein 21B-like n=1 Tax=Myxocyprinus asiaticus TaxID=70543 RepID=UPI00222222B7|nr:PHD finger protein 21B-like [Myxocyprinus asiaticus]
MELQGLQESLKVEVHCHQKLTVRSCPVGTAAKPLALIKQPSQSIAISVVPAKTPVSMVTAHINGQKALSSETLQMSPINLQTPAGQSISRSQMLGALTAIPIKVPHVSSLQRLAGHSPSVLPQVRPKTLIPDSLPLSPCSELQQSGQTRSMSQGRAVVSPKSQGASLPTANSTVSHNRLSNGQEDSSSMPLPMPGASSTSASAGVTFAIISAASPVAHGVSGAIKVKPLIFSPDSKVIIIQPQIPSNSKSSPASQTDSPVKEPRPDPSTLAKKEEDPEKIDFMVALGLVTTEHLEEIQSKRHERKRRSTANPAYSGLFEPERKRLAANYLNGAIFLSARDSDELCWKEELQHDDHCAVCKQEGDLQPCHTCTRAYHPDCLNSPLKTATRGMWMCPKCHKKILNKENLSWPQNFIQSYVTHKTVREEERRKLMRRNTELKKECEHLSEQDQKLCKFLSKCMEHKEHLLGQQRNTQASLERLKTLIRLIQRDHMIQVTMTATTTRASLLSLPWIKATGSSTSTTASPAGPSAVLHKNILQPHDNN